MLRRGEQIPPLSRGKQKWRDGNATGTLWQKPNCSGDGTFVTLNDLHPVPHAMSRPKRSYVSSS